MKINLREKATGNKVEAYILPAKKKDMPLKRDGWNFDWQKLIRFDQNFQCYKVVLKDSPNIIEALALFSYINNELFYMNQVEASPTNRSNNGKYEAAGALIAYGCSLALENPNSNYHGALGLTSKTELIPLYKNKYFAELYPERRMLIEPAYGQILISSYL